MARENSLKLKLSFGGWSISIDPMNAFKTATALFLTDAGFAKTADFQWRHQPPHCTYFFDRLNVFYFLLKDSIHVRNNA